jgi:tRNA nucleotidyltransferase (CCA-adding enzyme)
VSQNLSERIKNAFSSIQLDLIQCVAKEATELGFPLYIVGGVVRDLVLGRVSTDFDLVVEGDAPTLARALEAKYGGKVTEHSRFGTAKWDIQKSSIVSKNPILRLETRPAPINFLDLVSARSEIYKHPAALPTVKKGRIDDDLRRRDFTINTLAIRLDGEHYGELRDDFGGMADSEQGLIRVLHLRSFIDDPTRMYRAIRYEQRFGFKIDEETLKLIPEARSLIDKLSAQRIRHELDLILEEPSARATVGRLSELDLLRPIHASLPWDGSVNERFLEGERTETLNRIHLTFTEGRDDHGLDRWLLWLMGLSEKQLESLNKRLHFSASHFKALLAASQLFATAVSLKDWKPSKCVNTLDELPLSAIHAVYLAVPGSDLKLPLENYINEWRHIKARITGSELKRLGLTPGPAYRTILQTLRNAWIDGEIQNEKEEKGLLEKILRKH